GVGEHQGSEGAAVDGAIRGEDRGSEALDDRLVSRLARRRELVAHLVEVEGGESGRGQAPDHLGLPAGNAPREPDAQHVLRPQVSPRAATTVFFIKSAMVRGPTPRGTGVSAEAISRTWGKWTSPTSA